MKFKVGDRVKYTSNSFVESSNNPLWNGKHGRVVGTVNSIEPLFAWSDVDRDGKRYLPW